MLPGSQAPLCIQCVVRAPFAPPLLSSLSLPLAPYLVSLGSSLMDLEVAGAIFATLGIAHF